jgi:peptidoglycan/LPS O-acetylase OafA/YrhL
MLKNPIVLSILAVAVLIPLGGMVAHGSQHTLSHAEGLGFIRCTCEFISGALLSLLYKHKSPPNLPGDIALLLGTIFLSLSLFGGYIELMALPGFSLILMSCATNSGMSKILLGNRVIYTLGEISFSLYMIHRFIFTLAKAMSFGMGPSVTIFIMLSALLAIFPLAWGAWRFIELPGQAFGRRFSRRSGGVKIN